jgi:O-antigen ligase
VRIEPASEDARSTPYRSAVLIFVLGAVGWFGYGGPLGFVVLASLGGLLLAPLTLRVRWPPVEWLALAALTGWAALSMLWSAAPVGPLDSYEAVEGLTALKLPLQLALYGLLAVAATKVAPAGARRAMLVLTLFVVVWSLLLLADGLSGGRAWAFITGLFGVETPAHLLVKKAAEGGYVLAVLVWPVLGFLMGRRRPLLALLILAAAVVGMAGLSAWSAVVALFAGLGGMLLVGALRGLGARALGLAAALVTVLAPILIGLADRSGAFAAVRDDLTASWAARTRIWSFAAERVAERPLQGWGLDASRTFGEAIPLHPHDAALQLWLELGVVGVLIACAFWLLLSRRVARLAEVRPAAGQVAAASYAAYFTVGALSFGVWQEWWLAVGALTFVACAVATKVRPETAPELSEIAFTGSSRGSTRYDLPDDTPAL